MSLKGFPWLVSMGALGLLIVVRYAVPGAALVLLLTLMAASFGLILFASPLGPLSCKLEEKLIDRTRSKAAQYIGQAVDGQWVKVLFKPVFATPVFAARILRFLGSVVCLFAAVQIYTIITNGTF